MAVARRQLEPWRPGGSGSGSTVLEEHGEAAAPGLAAVSRRYAAGGRRGENAGAHARWRLQARSRRRGPHGGPRLRQVQLRQPSRSRTDAAAPAAPAVRAYAGPGAGTDQLLDPMYSRAPALSHDRCDPEKQMKPAGALASPCPAPADK